MKTTSPTTNDNADVFSEEFCFMEGTRMSSDSMVVVREEDVNDVLRNCWTARAVLYGTLAECSEALEESRGRSLYAAYLIAEADH